MPTYLRFTRTDWLALTRACRTFPLTDDAFRDFKPFLLKALAATPELAARIASFRTYQLGILFEGLRARRAEVAPALTAEECRAILRAGDAVGPCGRFLSSFQS